jgi:hypothetical protein
MNDSRRIIYTPRPDASPESEAAALAAVYRFAIEAASKREKTAESSGGEDAKQEIKQ